LSFWENSKPLLLVYRQMEQQTLDKTINVMLPPQFYTLKKETLPIKYHFQVKKIAPSLFEGLIEEKEAHDYFVYKEGDAWVFIAYNPKEIHSFLESKGIKAEQVAKLFFAQQVSDALDHPVLLGEKNALISIDGTVATIPRSALKAESAFITLDETMTPKQGITIHSAFSSVITRKQALGLSTLFTLFALTFFVEGWRYDHASEDMKAEINALLKEYPALQSQYKRRSISEKYRAIDSLERKKRDTVKTLASMLFKGVKVDRFSINDKNFKVRFRCSDAKVVKHLREYAKKEGFSNIKTLSGNIVSIEENL